MPVAVVAPADLVDTLDSRLGPAQGLVQPQISTSESAARESIADGDVVAAYVPVGAEARLLVASGRSPATATLAERVFTAVAEATGAKLTVEDVAPLSDEDPHGLSIFYLVVGWALAGYLMATVMGIVAGMTAVGTPDAAGRLGVLCGYALASGLASAAVTDFGFGVLPGTFFGLAALGWLTVFAVAAVTLALESLAGLVGTFLAVIVFVVFGNPAAGGPWPNAMLAEPWRTIGPILPGGAAVEAARQVSFFDGRSVGPLLAQLLVYAGVAAAVVFALAHRGRPLFDLAGSSTTTASATAATNEPPQPVPPQEPASEPEATTAPGPAAAP